MRSKTEKIVVVIPTYNDSNTLFRCFKSLTKQSLKLFKIIIVDNGSNRKVSECIEEDYSNVKVIFLNSNLGVAQGRNIGMKALRGKYTYLLFFDHDMIAGKNMIKELLKVAEMDNTVGIVTPKIYYWGDKKRIWSAGTGINLWTGQIIFRGGKDVGQYEKIEEVQVAPAAMLVKKDVIEQIKGFDEKYFATFEDTDFCFRARKKNFKIMYVPKAVAYHRLPTDPKKEARRLLDRAYWIGRNRILFMKDYGKNFLVFLFFIPLFTLYYLYLSLKYKKAAAWLNFVRGSLDGMLS